jgi:hypothetical protein
MDISIVFTTIYVPELLYSYADNFEKYGHKDEVEIIIIGDHKTPREGLNVIRDLQKKGMHIEYWDIEKQEAWLKSFPSLARIIPYNSDNRRNIGFLIAFEGGSEIIISIDDDNYASPDSDFIAGHKVIGKEITAKTARSKNGWFNICTLLETDPPRHLYPRGFPYAKRWNDTVEFTSTRGKVMMNAGLWLQDPDVDAVSRLNEYVQSVKVNSDRILLDRYIWSPINTQNTSIHRDVLSCYYYISMDASIGGVKLDRYGDIWSGFFAKKVIDYLDDRVSIGLPVVIHDRTPHDLLKDLQNEFWGMILTEELIEILDAIELSGSNYSEAYLELAYQMEKAVSFNSVFPDEAKSYFKKLTEYMRIWVDTCLQISGG